jgi:hypothetical protein
MTRAPISFASCSAKIETPPVPSKSTFCPAVVGAFTSAAHAVTPAHGKVAACSKDKLGGAATRPCSGSTTCSDKTPSMAPPRLEP